jgi:hypothetical protein
MAVRVVHSKLFCRGGPDFGELRKNLYVEKRLANMNGPTFVDSEPAVRKVSENRDCEGR